MQKWGCGWVGMGGGGGKCSHWWKVQHKLWQLGEGWSLPMMIPYLPSCVAVPLWVSVHRAVCQFLHPVFPGLERKHHHTPFTIMCVWITTTNLTCLLMNICVQTIVKAIWVSDLSHSPSLSIVLQAAASIFRKVFPKHTHNWDTVGEEAGALQHSLCHQQGITPKSQPWPQVKLQPALSSGWLLTTMIFRVGPFTIDYKHTLPFDLIIYGTTLPLSLYTASSCMVAAVTIVYTHHPFSH